MLSVPCPNCHKLLQVVETSIDRESQCPACGTVFRPDIVSRPALDSAKSTSPSSAQAQILGALAAPEERISEWPNRLAQSNWDLHAAKSRPTRTNAYTSRFTIFLTILAIMILGRMLGGGEGVFVYSAGMILLVGGAILVIRRVVPVLIDLRNGYFKAAGRSTLPKNSSRDEEDMA